MFSLIYICSVIASRCFGWCVISFRGYHTPSSQCFGTKV